MASDEALTEEEIEAGLRACERARALRQPVPGSGAGYDERADTEAWNHARTLALSLLPRALAELREVRADREEADRCTVQWERIANDALRERNEAREARDHFCRQRDALAAELREARAERDEALVCGEMLARSERDRCAVIADEEAREWASKVEHAEWRAEGERYAGLADVASTIAARIRTGRCGVRVGGGTPIPSRCDLLAHHEGDHRNPDAWEEALETLADERAAGREDNHG